MTEPAFEPIGHVSSDLTVKFGIPRQSGLVPELLSRIYFRPEFSVPEAFRGLGTFTHIWVIWGFSEAPRSHWTPTVRPPRLGGNTRMGVFATRSPVRPNPLGLSCVRLEAVRSDPEKGTFLEISGADMLDGTPVYDIKPYIPYTDSHPEASAGFSAAPAPRLSVDFPESLLTIVPEDKRAALTGVIAQDPRPSYQDDPQRVYAFEFAGIHVEFTVDGTAAHVTAARPADDR